MAPGSADPSEAASDEESVGPSRAAVEPGTSPARGASPAPSTGTGEVEEEPQHTTPSKDSDLPEYLKFD
eukprot:2471290-Rhodomonas_salina.1